MGRCTWLTAEALRFEGVGTEADTRGSTAEALLHYRRAQVKFVEAAALCPEGHPDKLPLQDHAQDVSLRLVYLESLSGAAATIPPEDHIQPLELSRLDIATALEPAGEREISELVAGMGVSGEETELSEQGFLLVAALRSGDEMGKFLRRVLEAGGRGVCNDGETQLADLAMRCVASDGAGADDLRVHTFAEARDQLLCAPWVAPLDRKDKLEVAVAFEGQAKELEARGFAQDAVKRYSDAIRFFQHVLKYDERGKNPRIAEMMRKRISDLEVSIARLTLGS